MFHFTCTKHNNQTSCRLRNFSILSVLALTVSNVFLTLRLLQTDCGHHLNNDITTSIVPKSPIILTPASQCLEYILADSNGNVSEKAVFSGLDLKLGRWDSRRMFKVFDFVSHGEKFTELSEKLNVTLATQSSIEKIFSLVQGKAFTDINYSLMHILVPSLKYENVFCTYIYACSFTSLVRSNLDSR